MRDESGKGGRLTISQHAARRPIRSAMAIPTGEDATFARIAGPRSMEKEEARSVGCSGVDHVAAHTRYATSDVPWRNSG